MAAAEYSLISAFIIGIVGGVHCIGMCGGIVTALSFATAPDAVAAAATKKLFIHLSYNLGRISSYAVMGALFGWLGQLSTQLVFAHQAQVILKIIAGVFMLLLGLYLCNWWRGLTYIEKLGGYWWRLLEPFARRLIPIRSPAQGFAVGLVWGWLPCGLVYSVLVWSLSSGGAVAGASLMLAFGLGTLPNLLLMGLAAGSLQRFFHRQYIKTIAGVLVMGFAIVMLYQVFV